MPRRDDFSNQAFGVQIVLDDDQKIAQVFVGRRPPGLYGGRDRSHLTAWRTFVDGVRRLVADETLPDAMERVIELAGKLGEFRAHGFGGQLRKVPRGPAPVDDGEELERPALTPADWYQRSGDHLAEVAKAARTYLDDDDRSGDQDVELMLAQNLIAGYLHRRNTLPLTAVPENFPRGGENAAAADIAAAETAAVAPGGGTVAALWNMLDAQALGILATGDQTVLFGQAVDPAQIVRAAVADHIVSMELSYPYSCRQTNFRTTAPPANAWGTWAAPATGAAATISSALRPPVNTFASRPLDGEFDRFAVQLDLANDQHTIRQLYIGSRPAAPAGRHSTAWVVLCDYVRACVVGSPVENVPENIRIELHQLGDIHQAIGVNAPPAPDPDCPGLVDDVQRLLGAFLGYLNSTEGAIVDTGGLSPAGTEALNRAKVRQVGGLPQVAALFDSACLAKLHEGGRTDVIALRVALHLYLAGKAYGPSLTAQTLSELDSETGTARLLNPVQMVQDTADHVNILVWEALDLPFTYNAAKYASEDARFTKELSEARGARTPKRQLERQDSTEFIPDNMDEDSD